MIPLSKAKWKIKINKLYTSYYWVAYTEYFTMIRK